MIVISGDSFTDYNIYQSDIYSILDNYRVCFTIIGYLVVDGNARQITRSCYAHPVYFMKPLRMIINLINFRERHHINYSLLWRNKFQVIQFFNFKTCSIDLKISWAVGVSTSCRSAKEFFKSVHSFPRYRRSVHPYFRPS